MQTLDRLLEKTGENILIANPVTSQVLFLAKAIENHNVTLTDDLREAIATLNATCARVHYGKDPRPIQELA